MKYYVFFINNSERIIYKGDLRSCKQFVNDNQPLVETTLCIGKITS